MLTPRHLEWWLELPTNIRWWLTKFGQWLCQRRGHPGVIWFNPEALEPNMDCTRCGKDIG